MLLHFRPTKMSLELLTDAHVSMCGIDVQTSRSRDKGEVQKAKTLFALSPFFFLRCSRCRRRRVRWRHISLLYLNQSTSSLSGNARSPISQQAVFKIINRYSCAGRFKNGGIRRGRRRLLPCFERPKRGKNSLSEGKKKRIILSIM